MRRGLKSTRRLAATAASLRFILTIAGRYTGAPPFGVTTPAGRRRRGIFSRTTVSPVAHTLQGAGHHPVQARQDPYHECGRPERKGLRVLHDREEANEVLVGGKNAAVVASGPVPHIGEPPERLPADTGRSLAT